MDKNYILHKYLNGEATPAETDVLKTDPEFAASLKISEAAKAFETPAFNSEATFQSIQSKLSQKEVKVRPLFSAKQFMRVAAVIAIILTGYWFLDNRDTAFSTQIAQKENFLLPDASEVSLNAMSNLSYNKNDWKKERTLTLDGEAYFKVKKGSKFSVETPQGIVSVLGTQFNVFSRGNDFVIACYEGLVSVAFQDELVKVPAGNIVAIKNGVLKTQEAIADVNPSWIRNESSFKNVSVALVLEELQRYYPITITTENNLDKEFTGSFTHTDLNTALRSICDPLQLNFTIANDEVTLYAKNSN
ncbi:MAG: FecR domain-containing protein [Flavobacteriaceae bacterium]